MVDRPDPLIAKLVARLYDGDPVVRRNAAGALRLHGPRSVKAIYALADLMADEDDKVRKEAKRALHRLYLDAA